jgi:hypothetical protein
MPSAFYLAISEEIQFPNNIPWVWKEVSPQ